MRVTVIISNYNYEQFLPDCIESVLKQSDAPDEVIVVDDGSTDASANIINSYGDKIISVFQKNSGQAVAINAGFLRATGDIICFLDADDIFFPEKIRNLKNIYSQNPEADWVFHGLKEIGVDDSANAILNDTVIVPHKINVMNSMRRGKLRYHAPATSGLSFRRDFIKQLFPLPVSHSIYISDHYIKFYALATGKGLDISGLLGGQRIHGGNHYSGHKADAARAKILVNAGYYLYEKMPQLKKFCSNLVCEGLLCAKRAEISREVEDIAGKYISHLKPSELFLFKCKLVLKLILGNVH